MNKKGQVKKLIGVLLGILVLLFGIGLIIYMSSGKKDITLLSDKGDFDRDGSLNYEDNCDCGPDNPGGGICEATFQGKATEALCNCVNGIAVAYRQANTKDKGNTEQFTWSNGKCTYSAQACNYLASARENFFVDFEKGKYENGKCPTS